MRKIVQRRPCDGACCRASPLRRTEDGLDCVFRDPACPERGCTIMTNPERLAELAPRELRRFQKECVLWPHGDLTTQGSFGDCCWDWADADSNA